MIDTGWQTTASPTMSGITLGNGTAAIRWRVVGGQLLFSLQLAFGSSTSIAYAPSFEIIDPKTLIAIPTWANVGTGDPFIGACSCMAYDSSAAAATQYIPGVATLIAEGASEGTTPGASTVYAGPKFATGRMDATVPFTWTTGDILVISNALEAFGN